MSSSHVNHETLQAAIRDLGLSGQVVCVHASLRSFGHVVEGAQTIVQAFLDTACTLMVATHSYGFAVAPPTDQRVPRNGWDYAQHYVGSTEGTQKIYTPAKQEISDEMGALPAAVLAHPAHVRGDHPLNSLAAVGPLAHKVMAEQGPLRLHAPLAALAEAGGSVVLMGVGLDKMTLLHYAEQQAGRQPFRRWANDRQGNPQMVEAGGCSDGFEQFRPLLQPLERTHQVGQSLWRIYPAAQTVEIAAAAMRADPSISVCHSSCERCRDACLGGPLVE